MKRLGLLRHAKSSWDNLGQSDFDRPLNNRGLRDAPRMGELLAERGVKPGALISSAAKRAHTTAALVGQQLGFTKSDLRLTEKLYLASADDMLAVLDEMAANTTDVILVGHNPGITALANLIADTRIDNMPTAGFFCIETDVKQWSELRDQPGNLIFFASPKNDLR